MLPITLKDPAVISINNCVDVNYIMISVNYSALPLICQIFPAATEIFFLQWDELSYSSLFPVLSAIVLKYVTT